MDVLFDELADQPRALREMARYYQETQNALVFSDPDKNGNHNGNQWMFTGMGASFHASWIGASIFRSFGLKAQAVETVDLVHYALPESAIGQWIVYISQSGSSGEVRPFLDWIPKDGRLVSVTNQPESELGSSADRILPMQAGLETLIAAKTYLNSLGILWLLARRESGNWSGGEFVELRQIADHIEAIISNADQIRARFNAFYDPTHPLLFLGHGLHAATARQAAMGMSEWAKVPAHNAGIGAYRHGFVESIRPGQRVIVFSPPGRTQESAQILAEELLEYGAQVLMIENGCLREPGENPLSPGVDEFLSPMLDIIPVQIAADGLTEALGIEPGFRYISKVVRQI